jgi:hypothetical protein
MGRERIQLHLQFGMRRWRRWRAGTPNTATERFLTVGQLADQRWFVDDSRDPKGAHVCSDERDACTLTDRIMARSRVQWVPHPAEFDGLGQPTEPGWRRSGHQWFRDEQTSHPPVNVEG